MRSALAVVLVSAACGGRPVSPTGWVQGTARDARNQAPIEGVKACVPVGAGESCGFSNEHGRYVVGSVPAGSPIVVQFSRSGFATLEYDALLDDAAGDSAQGNSFATIDPLMIDSPHPLFVYVSRGGQYVEGLEVYLRHLDDPAQPWRIIDELRELSGPHDLDGSGGVEKGSREEGVAVFASGVATGQCYRATVPPTDVSEKDVNRNPIRTLRLGGSADYCQRLDDNAIEIVLEELASSGPPVGGGEGEAEGEAEAEGEGGGEACSDAMCEMIFPFCQGTHPELPHDCGLCPCMAPCMEQSDIEFCDCFSSATPPGCVPPG